LKVLAIGRCIGALCLGLVCFVVTGCGGGASATTTPPNNPPASSNFQFATSSLNFGNVNVGSSKTLNVTMSNSGGSSVTVNQFAVSATTFSVSGVSLPLTLNAGQTASATIGFAPSAAGSANATVTAMSSSGSVGTLGLSGTGVQSPPGSHSVVLSWLASSSPNILAYNVYRATSSSGPFTKIGNVAGTTFTDTTVQSGQTYFYEVTAVDNTNMESSPSATVSASVP
jgi:hypothetical protein